MGSRGPEWEKVERLLVEGAKIRNGRVAKMKDESQVGCPDRKLFLTGLSRPIWVETKAPNGKLESWQKRYHKELRRNGEIVLVLWSPDQVALFWEDVDAVITSELL